jgi:hypothetical protein
MPCAPRMSRLKMSAIGPVIGSLSPNATSTMGAPGDGCDRCDSVAVLAGLARA